MLNEFLRQTIGIDLSKKKTNKSSTDYKARGDAKKFANKVADNRARNQRAMENNKAFTRAIKSSLK